MTPTELALYLFNGGICLGFGTWVGHLWNLMTGVVQ